MVSGSRTAQSQRDKSMTARQPFSFAARRQSFAHAFRGLRFMLQSQHNAWIHGSASIAVCCVGAILRISAAEWCLIILAFITVWVAETLNTAVECLTDLVSPEFHPLAGKVKDIAAGAVLISAVGAAVIGAIILIPPLCKWL